MLLTTVLLYGGSFIAFMMTFAVGSNDVCNALTVGSKAVTISFAIVVGGAMEFLGTVLMGGTVSNTIRDGFVNTPLFTPTPKLLALLMFTALTAAATWMLIATYFSLPVSTTHSLVGGLVGSAYFLKGAEGLRYDLLSGIVASWFLSPLMGGVLGALVFLLISRNVLSTASPYRSALETLSLFNGGTTVVMGVIVFTKILPKAGLVLEPPAALLAATAAGLAVTVYTELVIVPNKMAPDHADRDGGEDGRANADNDGGGEGGGQSKRQASTERAEQCFVPLMIATAAMVAFGHGSNDISNSVGPFVVIYEVAAHGALPPEVGYEIPTWILVGGGVGIVAGLALLGQRVMATIGSKISMLTFSRGYAAQLGASLTVVLATIFGMPVSSTHTMVGAVTGVALAGGQPVNRATIKKIALSWVITLPAGCAVTILLLSVLKPMLYVDG